MKNLYSKILKRLLKALWSRSFYPKRLIIGALKKEFLCPFCKKWSLLLREGKSEAVLAERKVIGGGRRKSICAICGSIDRSRLVYAYLKHRAGIFNRASKIDVLHIAPNQHLTTLMRASDFRSYVCGDLFAPGYSYPPYVQNMSILNIPHDDESFDVVICNHVLEHILDDAKAMKELCRVLRRGGMAILQVPISANTVETFEDESVVEDKERQRVFGQFDHVRIYGQDYVERLRRAGFTVNRVNIFESFKRYGLNKDEDVFVCTK